MPVLPTATNAHDFVFPPSKSGNRHGRLPLRANREVALQRLDNRQSQGLDASDGRRALYDQQALAFDPIGEEPYVLRVDGNVETSKIVAQVLCSMAKQS